MEDQTENQYPDETICQNTSFKKWQKICFVCQEETKVDQFHSIHYGGLVCFSCKAFFRRASQRIKRNQYYCKKTGDCQITVKSRRHCQKCRYEKCLTAGMNPDLVLTEDQKKVRFRKAFKRRKKIMEACSPPERQNGTKKSTLQNVKNKEEIRYQTIDETIFDPNILSQMFLDASQKNESQEDLINVEKNASKIKIEDIEKKFLNAKTIANSHLSTAAIYEKLAKVQLGCFENKIEKNDLCLVCQYLSDLFRQFASQLSEFTKHSDMYRCYLLKENTAIFVHFCLAIYFVSIDGQEQLTFMGEVLQSVEVNEKNLIPANLIHRLSLRFLHFSVGGIFENDAKLMSYEFLIQNMSDILNRHLNTELLAMFTYQILFYDQNTGQLCLSQENNDIVTQYLQQKNFNGSFPTLHKVLSKMSRNLNIGSWFDEHPNQDLELSYSDNEEKWLNGQFQTVDDAFKSVLFGEDFLKEFFMYSLGVPVSKKFFATYYSLVQERIKQVYKSFDEFNELPVANQIEVLGSHSLILGALFTVKLESCTKGLEQLQVARMSTMDESLILEYYSLLGDHPQRLKPILMRDAAQQMVVKLDQAQLDTFYKLIKSLTPIICNPFLFKMLFLILLTRPTSSSSCEGATNSPLIDLHKKYSLLLNRRSKWLTNFDKSNKFTTSEGLSQNVFGCIDDLNTLADIILMIIINS